MPNSMHQMTQDIQTRIRELAYMMWESAGRHQGMAMDYWLAAEKEVMSTFQAAAGMWLPATNPAEPAAADPPTRAPAAVSPKLSRSAANTEETTSKVDAVVKARPAAAKTTARRTSSRSKTTS